MTAIAAVRTKEQVFIGGDSAASSGTYLMLRSDPKVFRAGSLLIGSSGSIRLKNLMQYGDKAGSLSDLTPQGNPMQWMVREFIPMLRSICTAAGMTAKHSEQEYLDGSMVVGFGANLFVVECDLQVGTPLDDFAACGCGREIALGALFSTPELSPKDRIRTALAAAERFSTGVRRPFKVLST